MDNTNLLREIEDVMTLEDEDTRGDILYPLDCVSEDQGVSLESTGNPQSNSVMLFNSGNAPTIETYIQIRQKGDIYYVYIDASVLTAVGSEEYASRFMVWLRSFPEDTSAQIYIYTFRSMYGQGSAVSLSENPRMMYFPPSQSALNALLMSNARTTFIVDRMVNHIEAHMALCADEIVFRPSGVLIIKPLHIDENALYFQSLFVFHKYLYNRAYNKEYLSETEYQDLMKRKRVVKYASHIQDVTADTPSDDTTA